MFMLDTSKLEQNELRILSGMARHVSLQTECALYAEQLTTFLKDKDSLLVDLVKALKRITNEWRSWNHKLFGGLRPNAYVASVDQIFELLEWTEKTYPSSKSEEHDGKSHWQFCVDTLQRYITIHAQMQRFYSKFIQSIYCPLIVYYKTKASRKTIAKLRKILNNWCVLLQTGTIIREDCFTNESIQFFMEVIFYSGCRDFYLVLRLIPDLCMKAAECVHMVQSLLDSTKSNGFERERSYILEVWQPIESFEVQTREERKIKELTAEKADAIQDEKEQNIRLALIKETLEDARKKSETEANREKELRRIKDTATNERVDLLKQLKLHKERTDEIKLRFRKNNFTLSNNETYFYHTFEQRKKSWLSVYSSNEQGIPTFQHPRTICHSDARQELKIDFQAMNIEMAKISQQLAVNKNQLKNISDDLRQAGKEMKALQKIEKLLEKEKKIIEIKLMDLDVRNRVVTRYMSRVTKKMKMAADRLPPVNK